jgi:hypothetical protein
MRHAAATAKLEAENAALKSGGRGVKAQTADLKA